MCHVNIKTNYSIKQDFEEYYTQRLNERNIVRLKLSRLKPHRRGINSNYSSNYQFHINCSKENFSESVHRVYPPNALYRSQKPVFLASARPVKADYTVICLEEIHYLNESEKGMSLQEK